MPHGQNLFEIEFDVIDHLLDIRVSSGAQRQIRLEPKSVAEFYGELMTSLEDLNIPVEIMARPVEIEDPIPFAEDTHNASYDPESVRQFWGQLVAADRVMNQFRAHFTGKTSPVHFFWGAMDLACTRFSGRTAPTHPGGAPNCPDWVMVEGYSHELASCGFWPGGSAEGSFYAYAYPEPAGFAEAAVSPEAGYYDAGMGEFLLPYADVRTARDPDALLLDFLHSNYAAAADNASWNRPHLEDDPARLGAS